MCQMLADMAGGPQANGVLPPWAKITILMKPDISITAYTLVHASLQTFSLLTNYTNEVGEPLPTAHKARPLLDDS